MRRYFKYLLPALMLALLSFSVQGPVVRARPALPENANCSAYCASYGYWNGTVDGAATIMEVVNPTLPSGVTTTDADIELYHSKDLQGYWLEVGIQKHGCGSGLDYFYNLFNSSGVSQASGCKGVPTGDIGNTAFFGATYYASNGGGINVFINNNASGMTICNPCGISTTLNAWASIMLDSKVIGSSVGTVSNTFTQQSGNQWHSSGSFKYQTRNFDSSAWAPPVPFYWFTVPATGNNGGVGYTCINDSGSNSCP